VEDKMEDDRKVSGVFGDNDYSGENDTPPKARPYSERRILNIGGRNIGSNIARPLIRLMFGILIALLFVIFRAQIGGFFTSLLSKAFAFVFVIAVIAGMAYMLAAVVLGRFPDLRRLFDGFGRLVRRLFRRR